MGRMKGEDMQKLEQIFDDSLDSLAVRIRLALGGGENIRRVNHGITAMLEQATETLDVISDSRFSDDPKLASSVGRLRTECIMVCAEAKNFLAGKTPSADEVCQHYELMLQGIDRVTDVTA